MLRTKASNRVLRLRILLVGMLLSAVGDNIADVGFGLYAVQRGSSQLRAAILLAEVLPAIAFGLIGGRVVDRLMRWWWWPVSLLLQAGLFAVMAVSTAPVTIVTMLASVSAVAALTGPVAKKLVATLTTDSSRSGAHLATVMGLSSALGVAIAGMSFSAGALHNLLWVDAISFVALAAVSVAVSERNTSFSYSHDSSAGGFRHLLSGNAFGGSGFALVIFTVFSTSVEGVSGMFVLVQHARLSSVHVGFALAAWGLGVVFGGRLFRPLSAGAEPADRTVVVSEATSVTEKGHTLRSGPMHGLALGAAGMGLCFVFTVTVLPPWWLVAVLYLMGGLANGGFNAMLSTIILAGVPAQAQGRAWAAFGWTTTCCFLSGYLVGGALGMQHAVAAMSVSGLLALCGAAIATFVRRRGLPNSP